MLSGYPASPQGQLAYLRDLWAVLHGVAQGRGKALLLWEPAWLSLPNGPPDPCENLALFDFDGDALPALELPSASPGRRSASIQVLGDFNGWDPQAPPMRRGADGLWSDTLAVAEGCHLLKFRTDGRWDDPLDYGACAAEDPTCATPTTGRVCRVAHPGTALGEIRFPETGRYAFWLDEGRWRYGITPLKGAGDAPPAPAALPGR